jgi:LemA protein
MLLILWGAIVLVLVAAVIFFILFYNRFQVLKNGADAGLSQIAVAMKKRFDMITALVDIVKSYAKFEREVFEKVSEIRSILQKPETTETVTRINQGSRGLLDRIAAVVESYPNLKASQNVTQLMQAITDVEDEIARFRYTYNNIVQDYNTRSETFPSGFVARLFRFKKLEYLQFEKESQEKPDARWKQ